MSDARAFMENYRQAFLRFDRDALVDCFAFPVQVVSVGGGDTVIASVERDAWGGVIDGILGAYRTLGVADGGPLELNVDDHLPRAGRAHVHWELRRDDGSVVYDFTALYTLAEVDGGLRVVGIVHDELPKLQAALAG